jgi:CheY-like chemotaxis protein
MPVKILIIDNTSALIHSWKKGLDEQYTTVEAMGGIEAVRKIKNETVDLVIANISLRTINGVEAIGKIRSSFDKIPIIVVHDQRDVLDLKQAKAYNVNAAMCQPVDYKKLIAEIERLLPAGQTGARPAVREAPAPSGWQTPAPAASKASSAGIEDDVEKIFYEGLSAISANNFAEAIGYFESIIKVTRIKRDTWRHYLDDALFQLGQCHAATGNLEKSNTYYKNFIAKAPHNLSFKSALLYLGKNYIALKDNAKAMVYLKQVINTPPSDSFATQARKLLKTIESEK